MPLRDVEQIVYFNAYVVLAPGNAETLHYKQLLSEDQWLEIEDQLYSEESTPWELKLASEQRRYHGYLVISI